MFTANRKDTLWHCFGNSLASHLQQTEYNQIIKALQAQGKIRKYKSFYFQGMYEYVRRVSSRLAVDIRASVTIEASIAIPVLLVCIFEVLSLLQCLSAYSGVLLSIKQAATPISVYGYAYGEVVEEEREFNLGKEVISSLVFSEVYLDTQVKKICKGTFYEENIQGGVQGINLLGSYIDAREGSISIIANYSIKPILSLTGRKQRMSNQLYIRMWTGYSSTQRVQEDYVYITENGNVYHITPDCTHLKLSIVSIVGESIQTARNDYGERYEACDKCCGARLESIYYITKKGDKYHEQLSCSGLKRTVSCVLKSSVEDKSLCQRCGQEGE